VHLLHLCEPAFVTSPPEDGGLAAYGLTADSLAALEKKACSDLKRLVPAEADARGVRTEIRVRHDPSVPGEIVAEAERIGAEVIVMGTHGRTGFGRILLGSVSADVLRRETAPVILVHDRSRRAPDGDAP
jgi:nucleotide-binding universal stress UspA family protein